MAKRKNTTRSITTRDSKSMSGTARWSILKSLGGLVSVVSLVGIFFQFWPVVAIQTSITLGESPLDQQFSVRNEGPLSIYDVRPTCHIERIVVSRDKGSIVMNDSWSRDRRQNINELPSKGEMTVNCPLVTIPGNVQSFVISQNVTYRLWIWPIRRKNSQRFSGMLDRDGKIHVTPSGSGTGSEGKFAQ